MKKLRALLTICLLCASFVSAHANDFIDSISIEYGDADDSVDIARIALQKDISDWLESKNIPYHGFIETSASYWKGDNNDLFAIAIAPVLRKGFCKNCNFRPYIEAGLGVALLSDDEIDGIDMSSNFQFESRLGVGLETENVGIHLRFMHYSNAGLTSPNDGIDILFLGFDYKF